MGTMYNRGGTILVKMTFSRATECEVVLQLKILVVLMYSRSWSYPDVSIEVLKDSYMAYWLTIRR